MSEGLSEKSSVNQIVDQRQELRRRVAAFLALYDASAYAHFHPQSKLAEALADLRQYIQTVGGEANDRYP